MKNTQAIPYNIQSCSAYLLIVFIKDHAFNNNVIGIGHNHRYATFIASEDTQYLWGTTLCHTIHPMVSINVVIYIVFKIILPSLIILQLCLRVSADKHLCMYLVVFNDSRYLHNLRTQCTTWTLQQDVFQPPWNLRNVIPIISDLIQSISTFFDVLYYFQCLLDPFQPSATFC